MKFGRKQFWLFFETGCINYCRCHVTDKQRSALDLTGAQWQGKPFITQSLQDDGA